MFARLPLTFYSFKQLRHSLFFSLSIALKLDKDNFIYSDKLILIDSHKRIRGYYSGASMPDVLRLNDEIKVLISEELLAKDTPLY